MMRDRREFRVVFAYHASHRAKQYEEGSRRRIRSIASRQMSLGLGLHIAGD